MTSKQPIVDVTAVDPETLWNEANVKEAVQVWNLSPQDEQKLRVLQIKLKDFGPHLWNDPHVVLAFAEAHGFEHAEEKFRTMMAWRKRNNIDSLLTDYVPHPLLMDNSPLALLKDYDNEGDPIYLERGGACDAKGLLQRFSKEQVMKHSIWLREVQSSGVWMDEYEQRQGRPVKDITVIYDLEGLCARHMQPNVISFFQQLMDITDNYYPGPVKRVIIIRSPWIFHSVWAIVKHFFTEECRSKMIFTSGDHLAELSKYMDLDVLPPCINPKGKGETAIGMPIRMEGGEIPSHVGQGGVGYVSPYADTFGVSQKGEDPVPLVEACSSGSESESDDDSPCKAKLSKGSSDVEYDTPLTIAATC